MPPPKHLKREKDKHAQESLGAEIPRPSPSEKRGGGLLKVHRMGVPEQPLHDMRFPDDDCLKGSTRERIAILTRSILRPEFIAILNKTNFFDIRAHYREGEPGEHLHMGEIYVYGAARQCSHNGQRSTGHAWIMIENGIVTQWHYCHGAAVSEGIPTFLLSIENYLMYIHLRVGENLPEEILDDHGDLRGWV